MKSELLKLQNDSRLCSGLNLVTRVFMVTLFLLAGTSKIGAYEMTANWMEANGVPGSLLPFVIMAEVFGGILLIVGYQTRLVALGLATFTILSAFLFHTDFSDQTQFLMFYKNLSITGGFLALMLLGGGRFSLDGQFKRP